MTLLGSLQPLRCFINLINNYLQVVYDLKEILNTAKKDWICCNIFSLKSLMLNNTA